MTLRTNMVFPWYLRGCDILNTSSGQDYFFYLILLLLFLVSYIAFRLSMRTKEGTALIRLQEQVDSLKGQLSDGFLNSGNSAHNQYADISSRLDKHLGAFSMQLQATTGQVGDRLDTTSRLVGEVKRSLGEIGKSAERIFEVGSNIQSLQDILKAPKLRGILGELLLGELLGQVFPKGNFKMQYRFNGGEAVDAALFLHQGIVSIDSKFPLENFRRIISSDDESGKKEYKKKFYTDVKRHVDAIASKYIRPDEGTLDFALMYIPAENVYYETVIKDNVLTGADSLSSYALKKKVIPVSPNTMYVYLQTVALGLKGLQIEKRARKIHDHIRRLSADMAPLLEDIEVIGKHLNNTRSRYDEAKKRFDRFNDRLAKVSGSMMEE
ncbi:MAG: DNA recombination protein RmuC [Nitrospinota bacterium]